ncbi:hypothetical protein PC129_g15790 [Phytophthora cactorum]|uniref:Uncharacterized protein n=1 Tax=Phytophthora cactorum TaxID=29920 RepID=A0A329RFT2_9STRA|nr:hypothetical protein Pcac1_g18696 [Phytophthora cactorum]KAG2805614.1 hypothetical protein PC112_g18201 [Phytophthora cactorum]KAG2807089.1 hypothetical protein PC111_g17076 [Phytophthora cactorum]KAG2846331.1 hypothetical protein PC113_g17993 [Phytophthora cactorum]KAG2917284.1 hypothetical protein PC117_g17489 [Phytophthora cactorum]
MASLNAYAQSLRSDKPATKAYEEGVPFFVPQLSKVKTSVMCQGKTQKLLFKYETGGAFTSPLSPKVLPYRKQGNHSLYTEENLLKRQKLMEDPDVLQAIERFWVTFPCIRQGGEAIPMHDYVDVFMKFYKALVAPSEFSIGEARYIVEKDWAKDSIDGENMSKLLFFGSLFEVADIWTIDIGAEQYVAFLNKLFERVTMIIYDHVKLQWFTAFAELDKIRSFDDPTPPDEDPSTQNLSSNEKADALAPVSDVPRPPLIRKNTRSPNGLLPPPHPEFVTLEDQRLPLLTSARRGHSDSESNSEGWGSSISDDFDHNSRDHLFERGPTKTRLEQVLEDKRTRTDGDMRSDSSKTRLPRLTLPETSLQQVLLPIPSIYLNPDLTGVHDAERAARRRLRQKAKLVMRLRRITY